MRALSSVVVAVLCSCGPAGQQMPEAVCGDMTGNAQFVAGDEPVWTQATGTWSTSTSLVGTDFVTIPQLDLEFLVSEEDCVHKLTLNIRAPREGAIPFGTLSTNKQPVFSGGYAGDLPSQVLAEPSTLELTALADSVVSGRFSVTGKSNTAFTLGAFTNVFITGLRPRDP